MKEKHLHCCKTPLHDLKHAKAGQVIIFSDEKTWTVDPVQNCQNDRYLSFGDVDEAVCTLTTTKHPTSVMSLGFVASDGKAPPLHWFPTEYRLTGVDYIKVLEDNFLLWVRDNYPDMNVIFQQDGTPANTSKKAQEWLEANIPFWPKEFWPPYSPDANPLDFTFWGRIEARACTVHHPNIDVLKTSVNEQ